ncbi:MAG: FecR family protein [Telluria sp.]
MTHPPLKRTATKALLFCFLMLTGALAWAAQVAGTVIQLSGPLLAKKPDGKVKVLALKSEVEVGDTLVSEKNTYAQLKLIDNSEITLRPNSSFKIDDFSFQADKPEGDNAAFSLIKGGLRSVTGALGKRNREKFAMKTPGATIGIRGTTFIAEWVEASPEAVALQQQWRNASTASLGGGLDGATPLQLAQLTPTPLRAPGLYVTVTDGMIHLSNAGGSQNFAAGQFGYVPSVNQPPVILPANPGIQFTPPPAFNMGSSGPSAQNGAAPGKAKSVDCEVR